MKGSKLKDTQAESRAGWNICRLDDKQDGRLAGLMVIRLEDTKARW